MLNHNEVIEKLTLKQKFSLLTDIRSLSDPDMTRAGVPHVSMLTLETLMTDLYEGLTPARLANSWDSELIRQVSYQTMMNTNMRMSGAKLLMTPAAKPQLNVYRPALSEDPFLSGMLSFAYAEGVHQAGGGCCMDGFYLTESDVEQMDLRPDMTAIGELLLRPYIIATKDSHYRSILTSDAILKNGYRGINEKLASLHDGSKILGGAARLCNPRNADETLAAILAGKIVVRGSASALESAYEKYHYIMKAIEDEIVTMEDLDEALADGSAISDDALNQAVRRVLDFAHTVTENPEHEIEVSENLRHNAFVASTVLLKNENSLLPLKAKCRVAVIGQSAASPMFVETVCQKMGVKVTGRANGYDPNDPAGTADVEGALALAKKADKVLVFLGCNGETNQLALKQREMTLPANQAELLHALSPYKDKIIAVMDCDYAADMSFASDVSALMLAPMGGVDGAAALADLLTGRACPSGKLACTLYENTSEHFSRLRQCKNAEKNKVGLFMGYRHYDSAELDVKFPFGHGLSYTSFQYSKLKVVNNEVIFTVKNTGSMAGSEIVQIYIGKPDSACPRPRKELCGFIRTTLKAGEKCEVRLDISQTLFYRSDSDSWAHEAGEYTVYVGSSVKDIRLTRKVTMAGEAYTPCTTPRSEYLQTQSNILSDGYAVNRKRAKLKKPWQTKLGIVILVILAALSAAFGYLAPNQLQIVLPEFLPNFISNFVSGAIREISYTVAGILLAIALLTLILYKCKQNRLKKQKAAADAAVKAELMDTADEKEFRSIDELFVAEFDTVIDVDETVTEEKAYVDDTSRYIDLNYTLEEATEDLSHFMQARGMDLTTAEAIRLISAMAASRLSVIDVAGVERDKFYRALSEYFGAPTCVETVQNEYAATHLMFRSNGNGGLTQTELVKLVESAKTNPNVMHVAFLRGIRATQLIELFMPYLKYFSNPLRENRIIVKDPYTVFTLPANLWFMAELAEGEGIEEAQAGILKTAAYLQLNVLSCDAPSEPSSHVGMGYYQFDHFIQRRKNRFVMDEDLWKKIDELETYTASHAAFRIGNKQWLQMEKYLAMLTSLETDVYAALDRALCVNLMPVISSLLKGKIQSGEPDLLETLEKIFGEDKVPLCCKAAKRKEAVPTDEEP